MLINVYDIDTLEAYIDKYTSMVPFLANGVQGPGWERPQPPSDAPPKEQISKAISMQVRGRSLLLSINFSEFIRRCANHAATA
jgi:hypothetical protein